MAGKGGRPAFAPLAIAHYNEGVRLYLAGQPAAAAAKYDAALAIEPKLAPAHSALGVLAFEAGDALAAEARHRQAPALDPDHPEFHNNLGLALGDQHRHDEALVHFDRAVAVDPGYVAAWSNRGVALHQLRRLEAALASFQRALSLDREDAESWSNAALALNDLARGDEALGCCQRAVALQPSLASAWANLGALLNERKRHAEALEALDRAIALGGDTTGGVLGDRLHTAMLLCDWEGHAETTERIRRRIEAGGPAVNPFVLLATPLSPALQLRCAELYAQERFPRGARQHSPRARGGQERIRLGYFSADFHAHATMRLAAELFERHDRARFEVIAFSFGKPSSDSLRERARVAFDRFIDVGSIDDAGVAALARELGIDIAIDLNGYTHDARPGIFARGAAPVQVSYLGYPGSLGTGFIDYLIADRHVVPDSARGLYAEEVVWLPHCYQPNLSWQPLAPAEGGRREASLPAEGFVFCSFNNSFKITPEVFDVWMRLLHAVPGSVFWLFAGVPGVSDNLVREAAKRGIGADRLVFAPWLPGEAHLRRQGLADLFLDTFHCGAHTTASDALRAGLPIVTCRGDSFASRVAGSLLEAIGAPDTVTDSLADYEALALALARDRQRLAGVRARLVANAPTHPLFDAPRYVRDLEAAYTAMHERSLAGAPPEGRPGGAAEPAT